MKKSFLALIALAGALTLSVQSCNKNRDSQTSQSSSEEATENVAEEAPVADAPEADFQEVAPEADSAATPAEDGYITTASGLKYKVVKEGTGNRHPTATDVVSVKYTGRLTSGQIFDSTDNHGGEPISFPLNRVIPGWTEGVQLMVPGDVYEFVIPPQLAYGEKGAPGAIPPNATLIFEVELVGIE